MRGPSNISVALGLTLLVCLGPVAQSRAAVVLFNNLGDPGGSYSSVPVVSLAQAFTTTPAGYVLSEVSLPLWKTATPTGTYEIQIWDSTGDGSQPGSQVGPAIYTGLAQNLSDTGGSLLTVPGLNVSLSPNTTYYLVSANVSVTPSNQLFWKLSDNNVSSFYEFSSGSWGGPYISNLEMKIIAVPEPNSAAMLTIGIGGLGVIGYGARGASRRLSRPPLREASHAGGHTRFAIR